MNFLADFDSNLADNIQGNSLRQWGFLKFILLVVGLMNLLSVLCWTCTGRAENIAVEFELDGEKSPWPYEFESILEQQDLPFLRSHLPDLFAERLPVYDVRLLESTENNVTYFKVLASRRLKISKIILDGLGSVSEIPLKKNFKSKVGQPVISQDLNHDAALLLKSLHDLGYFEASLESISTRYTSSGRIEVTMRVNRNEPCRIGELEAIPRMTALEMQKIPVEVGAICNLSEIKERLESESYRLRSAGYLDAKIGIAAFNYSSEAKLVKLKVNYLTGKRTRIEIANVQSGVIAEENFSSSLIFANDTNNEALIEETRELIRQNFLKKGNLYAVVNPPSVFETETERVYRFSVSPGEKYSIGQLTFKQQNIFTKEELVEVLNISSSIFDGKKTYVDEELDSYVVLLRNFFLKSGYLNVGVTDPEKKVNTSLRQVDLEFTILPGVYHEVSVFEFRGFPKNIGLETLQENSMVGKSVSLENLQGLESASQGLLLEAGFASAKVLSKLEFFPETDMPSGQKKRPTKIVIIADPGPQVRIGEIFGEGDFFGKRDRVLSESGLVTGNLYTPRALEQARTRILKHDLFANIVVEPYNLDDIKNKLTVLDVVIRTTPKSGFALGFQPGYGTVKGYRFLVDAAKNNLTSTGTKVTGTMSISQEKQQFLYGNKEQLLGRKISIGLVEPLLKIGNFSTPLDLSMISGLELTAQPLANRLYETFEIGLSWKPFFFDSAWNFYNKIQHEWSKVVSRRFEPLETLDRLQSRINELTFGVQLDKRNNVDWPTKGSIWEISSSHARYSIFSEVEFDRYSFETAWFHEFTDRFSNAFSIYSNVVQNIRNKSPQTVTVPGSRRSSLSGRSLVRGFKDQAPGLGPLVLLDFAPNQDVPKDSCKPVLKAIGSTNVMHFRQEFRYRTRFFSNLLGFAWFTDAGTAFFRNSEVANIEKGLERDVILSQVGSTNDCVLIKANLIVDSELRKKSKNPTEYFFRSLYVASGIGARIILPSLTTINFDWGVPLREPADVQANCIDANQGLEEVDQSKSRVKVTCAKRRSTFGPTGILSIPGAFHIGIGANF